MKMLYILLAAMVFGGLVQAQSIGKKPPQLMLQNYSPDKDDGTLHFQVDVRMVDCISYIELKNDVTKKPILVQVGENDYVVDERNGNDILLRIPVCSLKDLLKKKEAMATELTIFSKAGKPIYQNHLSVNRYDLIQNASDTWR